MAADFNYAVVGIWFICDKMSDLSFPSVKSAAHQAITKKYSRRQTRSFKTVVTELKCSTFQYTNRGVRFGTWLKFVERRSSFSGSLLTRSQHLTHSGDLHRFTVLVEESVSVTAACPYHSCSLESELTLHE